MSEVPRRSVSVSVREIFVEVVNRQDLSERRVTWTMHVVSH